MLLGQGNENQKAEYIAMDDAGLSEQDYQAFCLFLEKSCGIVLGENKHYLVNSRLKKILEDNQLSDVGELLKKIERDHRLRARVVDAMTTNETYWFRDSHPFFALKDVIFPELSDKSTRRPRIWCAASSTGQEPYTISMMVDEYTKSNPGGFSDAEIIATDISPRVLEAARKAEYDELTLSRGLALEYKKRYFTQAEQSWRINDDIKNRVRFSELNLMTSFNSMGKFQVIFCRNVLIYFSADLKKDIIDRLANSLEPGGYLFLGGSESMASYSDRFETVRYSGGLVYKLAK